MGKIKSAEALEDFIHERQAARKMEIVYLKSCLEAKARKKSKEQLTFSKALVVMSYSHWEGFVKETVKAYLGYLNSKGLQRSELSSGLFAAYVHSSLFQKPLSPIDAIGMIESMVMDKHDSVKFNAGYMADTESNLNTDVLIKITKRLGQDTQQWEEYRAYLDSVILKHRNDFAHGGNGFVDVEQAKEIADKVLEMMQRFSTEITNAVEVKSYLLNRKEEI